MKPLSLPKAKAQMKPGEVCSLAGWRQVALGTPATTLQEVELTVQRLQAAGDPGCRVASLEGLASSHLQRPGRWDPGPGS